MRLDFDDQELGFQREVRDFLQTNLPDDLRRRNRATIHLDRADYISWQKILHAKGWGAPGWPKKYGGPGWTPVQRYIFDEECARAGTPPQVPFGLAMVGPVIYTFGTEAQKQQHLPGILSGDVWWCQGYSEPGSGSDLASLKTKAIDDGDHYVVSGHKIWTTQAHFADWMFCLVRTDGSGKQQEGITFVLIDMNSPGITVRPIITIDHGHSVNEVFLDEVRVPKANRIGEEGQGWTYAKFLLGNERTVIAGVSRSKRALERLKRIAGEQRQGDRPLIEDAAFAKRVAQVEIELMGLECTNLRVLSEEAAGRGPGTAASLLKLVGTQIQQSLAELSVEALGYDALPYEPHAPGDNRLPIGHEDGTVVLESYLYGRASSIYGGSNEIQRNVIAKLVLGL